MTDLWTLLLVWAAALLLDHWLGEPRRWHPVVGFGNLAAAIEKRFNRNPDKGFRPGLLALVLAVVPPVLATVLLVWLLPPSLQLVVGAVGLWLALSLRGLAEHGRAVADALIHRDLALAREQVGRIVSRQTEALDETAVATAASESMLENGADAVFASLFWFAVAGLPGVVLHRAVNTLDAMWGYRTPRFLTFGRAAARLDDLLNWPPARLTALSYALRGNTRLALACWRRQAPKWDSPNGGPVMAAGAGALSVSLGGPAPYATGLKKRPILGRGPDADVGTIAAAIRLVERSVLLWLGVVLVLAILQEGLA